MFSDRRVHQLKLRTSRPELSPHAAFVLEDALRTASLPGLPHNGLLLIRRLDLGKLAANPTSISVAHRISSRLLGLSVSIVRSNSAEQPRAEIVWFPDPVEPYAILAELLAHNFKPQSWYWPRAVRGWSHRMSSEQGMRHVLFEVSRTPAGIAGAARVFEQVINTGGDQFLGRTLRPIDGQMLLAIGGIQSSDQISTDKADALIPGQIRHLSRSWRQTLSRLVSQWGPHDDRTTWMAHVAACVRQGMPSAYAAAGLLQELQQRQHGSASADREKLSLPWVPQSEITEAAAVRHRSPDSDRQQPIRDEFTEHHQPARSAGVQTESDRRTPHISPDLKSTNGPAELSGGQSDSTVQFERVSVKGPNKRISHQRTTPPSRDDLVSANTAADIFKIQPETDYTEDFDSGPFSTRSASSQNELQPWHADTADRTGPKEPAGVESPFAGLVFVVQTLEWLGIRETLTSHPLLEFYQLPARILWYCVDQLEVSTDDPICEFLPRPEPVPAEASFDFAAPSAWQNLLWEPASDEKIFVLRRIQDSPGKRVMYLDGNGLTIALWQNQIPAAVRRWARQGVLRRQLAVSQVKDLDLIIKAYMSAIGIFLNQYAHTTLHRLAVRPGYVATTRTHLDVTFDLARLDLGIRKAGLDIDPGWVSWLGRVVYIHYQGREEMIDV